MNRFRSVLFCLTLLLTGCAQTAGVLPPTAALPLASPTTPPTQTAIPATATATSLPFTPTLPAPTADPTLFGAIGTGEIQAYALESVANAIFTKTMDNLVAAGAVQAYQVTRVKIFPGSNGLLSEIIFNVRTTDPAWAADGGTPAADDWLNDKCYRFDFFTTDTEYQLKNRRLCS